MESRQLRAAGRLIGVGVGPGDSHLITVKGVQALKRSPVVAFPAGRQQPGTAEQIIAPWGRRGQTRLPLEFPFVQEIGLLEAAWEKAATQVWTYLGQGLDVAFACEGDIGFYSTFTYLAQTLQRHHPQITIEAVPGICSPLAATAVLGLPLTVRSQKLAVLPALYTVDELEQALSWAEVVVLMKVSSVYPQVWSLLKRHHRLEHSYVVAYATRPEQRIYTDLSRHPQLELPYFSLLIVQKNPESHPDSLI
ncbi:precorrin-2 C(20)-methyltransferase [filamentous cyanobacterium CCP5]|nr:precorrin-2 C(20)-methyltransferase [filamentous cyanobacterium CCP5]